MHANPQGRISTFYSYKGGTGRTMGLANVAWILASKGKRVLAIDWDLEAPGLHRYFAPLLADPKLASSPGLIDFLLEYWIAATHPSEDDDDPRWFERYADLAGLALPVLADFPGGGRLDVIGAGQQDGGYAERVTSFDWKAFYASFGGAGFLDLTFDRLRAEYDYVLIDSRTGVSDTAGICTVQLPDSLVVFFTLNNQSIEGASAIAHDALTQRRGVGRPRLAVFPVPSRIDLFERDKLEIRRSLVRERFTDLLDLDDAARKRYFAEIELLYVPFYSYEEQLATIVDRPNQHASLLGSLERLTGHVSAGEVQQLVPISDALRADFRAKYDAFHRGEIPAPGGEPDERWDIFLSCTLDDRPIALALYRQLQRRFKIFYAVEAITVGQNIVETVARAAASSQIAVILISRAALDSAALASEVELLLESDVPTRRTLKALRTKRVLPVLIGVEPHELPDSLAKLRGYRALVVPDDEQAPSAAGRAIITALGETPELESTLEATASTAMNSREIPADEVSAGLPVAEKSRPSPDYVPHRRASAWLWIPGLMLAAATIGIAITPSEWWSAGPTADESGETRDDLKARLNEQTEQLRVAKLELNRERGRRATLLAGDHARAVEALVLGVQAVGDYDVATEIPPAEASSGLLAALTKIGSDATLRHVLPGHRSGIPTLLYSGGGSTIASVDGMGAIRIWATSTGQLSATLNPYGPPPTRVVLADDGSTIAWSSADAVVHVWRVDANEEFASFGPLAQEVRDLAFWDEGANLAIATSRSVFVYELETKAERSGPSKRLGPYNQIALADHEHRFAFDTKSEIEVYSLDGVRNKALWPERLAQLVAPPGVASLEVLAGGKHVLLATPTSVEIHDVARGEWVAWLESSLASRSLIATASEAPVVAASWIDALTVQVWSAPLGSRSFRAVDDGIAGLALANDGSRLAVLGRGGAIEIWQVESLRRLTTVAGDASVSTMVFGPDGERLVTGSSDGSARLWNLRQRKSWDIADAGQPIRDLDVVAGLLATANNDRITRIWDLEQGREHALFGATSAVTALALVPGLGEQRGSVITTSIDGPTRWIDLDPLPDPLDPLKISFPSQDLVDAAGSPIGGLSVAVSPDGTTVAVGDRGGVVHTWDREGKPLATLDSPGPGAGVEVLAFSPDGKWLATGQDRTIVVWALDTGKQQATFEGHLSTVKSLSFSFDGTWIASSSGDKVARLWRIEDKKSWILEGHAAPLTAIAFFPNGRVVTASEDSSARVWRLETKDPSVDLLGHTGTIRSVAVAPDGQSIVTASDDGTARIWASDGTPIATLLGHRTGLVSATLSDDGKLLITASADGDLRTWPTTPTDWLRAGCEELFERAEYSQVSETCSRVELERRTDQQPPSQATGSVKVQQLDPTEEEAPEPTPTMIKKRVPKDAPGTPTRPLPRELWPK
jgi:WD40 repeat protein